MTDTDLAVYNLNQWVVALQKGAQALPIFLARAEEYLDGAESELAEELHSPFWDAMEEAARQLTYFHTNVTALANQWRQVAEQATRLSVVSAFQLGIDVIPDPQPTHARMRHIYRKAQKIPSFASIYETRRIGAKIDQTNAILAAGFQSLGDAIERLADRTVAVVEQLSSDLSVQIGSVEAALQESVRNASDQHAALMAECRRSEGAVSEQLRKDADREEEFEREALKMLDNIQKRRRPNSF